MLIQTCGISNPLAATSVHNKIRIFPERKHTKDDVL